MCCFSSRLSHPLCSIFHSLVLLPCCFSNHLDCVLFPVLLCSLFPAFPFLIIEAGGCTACASDHCGFDCIIACHVGHTTADCLIASIVLFSLIVNCEVWSLMHNTQDSIKRPPVSFFFLRDNGLSGAPCILT